MFESKLGVCQRGNKQTRYLITKSVHYESVMFFMVQDLGHLMQQKICEEGLEKRNCKILKTFFQKTFSFEYISFDPDKKFFVLDFESALIGATTLSITILSIMILSIMTLSITILIITILSIMILTITILSIMILCIMILSITIPA